MSGLSIRGPWRPLTEATAAALPGQLGVFEVASDDATVFIGYAGGRSRFGLRSEVGAQVTRGPGLRFRFEVNMQYLSRWRELLMWHLAHHDSLPSGQPPADAAGLGRLVRRRSEGGS